MYELSKRTSNFSDSVIRRMTRIANKYDAINLSQGFPDFAPPKEITDRLAEVAKMGHINMQLHGVHKIFVKL
jgi:aspartate/methionine/tyrosine aminotransferase